MKAAFFLVLLLITFNVAEAQNTPPRKPCMAPECSQFDFWLGEWDLTHSDTVHASNHVTREMDGCLTHEHFDDPSTNYRGESWSMYNPMIKKWQQTWVDNRGGYIALAGVFENGEMALYTEPFTLNGKRTVNRMVYYNIKKDSFDWRWEGSADEGKTWKQNWLIHYNRKK